MVEKKGETSRSAGTIQSVMRAFDVLEVVAQGGPSCSMTYIVDETGLPGPTVFRLLNTLAVRGYVIKTAQREYSVGPAFFAYNSLAGGTVGRAADNVLTNIVEKVGESASMAMRDRYEAIYVAHRTTGAMPTPFGQVGNGVPLHATAVGKCLLAAMPEKNFLRYLKTSKRIQFTSNTITDTNQLQREIDLVRGRGYAIDNEEYEVATRSVAVAVKGMNDFAIGIYGPLNRISDDFVDSVVLPALTETAESVGADLHAQFPKSRWTLQVPPEAQVLGIGI